MTEGVWDGGQEYSYQQLSECVEHVGIGAWAHFRDQQESKRFVHNYCHLYRLYSNLALHEAKDTRAAFNA